MDDVPEALRRCGGVFKHCHGNILEYARGLVRDGELLGAVLGGQFQWPSDLVVPEPVITAKSMVPMDPQRSALYDKVPKITARMLEELPVFIDALSAHLLSLIPPLNAVNQVDRRRKWIIDNFFNRRACHPETSLGELAHVLGLSEDRARHVVTELYGRGFGKLLAERRLDVAKRLLVSTNMTVTQVAEACGYADSHHFHRTFRKAAGKTPRAYRSEFRSVEGKA